MLRSQLDNLDWFSKLSTVTLDSESHCSSSLDSAGEMIYGLVHFSLESGVMQPVRYVHHLRLKFAKRSFHGGLQEFREHHADTVNRYIHSHVIM